MTIKTAKLSTFTLENISLFWLSLGSLVICTSVLFLIIFLSTFFVSSNGTKISSAEASFPAVIYTQTYSSDTSSLYPPLSMAIHE
jgi:hypothetical protein